MEETKKIAKLKKREAELQIAHENFKDWILSAREKQMDLNASGEELFDEFYKKIMLNEYGSVYTLAMAITKSFYVAKKEDEITSFIDPESYKIKKPVEILNLFSNKYLGVESDCKNVQDIYKFIAKIVSQKTQEVYGDYVFLELAELTKKENEMRRRVIEAFKEKGFMQYSRDPKFLIRPLLDSATFPVEKHQEEIFKTYTKIVKRYIDVYAEHIHVEQSTEQFNDFWNIVKSFLTNLEERMTEKTLNSDEFIQMKANVERFYNEDLEKICKTHTKEGKFGEYYKKVKSSVNNLLAEEATDEDNKILKDFYHRIKLINKALSIADENGHNFPANYFFFMPIHPATIMAPLSKLQKSDVLTKEQFDLICETKSLIRISFPDSELSNTGDFCNPKEILSRFKSKHIIGEKVVDMTDETLFDGFVSKVEGVMEEYDLPKNALCISTIGRDIFKGRNPISIPKSMHETISRNKVN